MNIPVHILKLFFAGMILWLLSCPLHSIAQQKINPEHYDGMDSDSVPVYHYDVIRNRPDSVKKITLLAFPIYGNIASINGIQGKLEIRINQNLEVSGNAVLLSSNYYPPSPYDYEMPEYSGELYDLGFEGIYYLVNKIYTGKIMAYFKLSHGSAVTAPFMGKKMWKLGIKLNVNQMKNVVSSDQANFLGYDINDPSGQKTNFANVGKLYKEIYNFPIVNQLYTTASVKYLSVGIQSENINDNEIKINDSKNRKIRNKNTFYADVLIAANISYDNIIFRKLDSIPQRTYNVDKFTSKQPFGFRFGWEICSLKGLGLTTGVETGLMPVTGYYIICKFGFEISPGYIKFKNLF